MLLLKLLEIQRYSSQMTYLKSNIESNDYYINNNLMFLKKLIPILLLIFITLFINVSYAVEGVTSKEIRIGGVMDLEGRSRGLGQGMKKGINAAIKNKSIKKRRIKFITLNDSYNPQKTAKSTKEMLKKQVLFFAGNVGTPTAKVSLPILAANKVPAVGFFTGAGLLRSNNNRMIINYRASYIQETKKVIESALKHGVKAPEICAYVQNDAYGMAGVKGILLALEGQSSSKTSIDRIKKILSMAGDNPQRNYIGPIGVYKRNTYLARSGYESLKAWENTQDVHCKIVVTVGAYGSIAKFIGYAKYKNEDWIYSAVSFTGASNLKKALKNVNVNDHVIMTQVVPLLDSNLELVIQAKKALKDDFSYVSLEGYIVGKMILKGLNDIKGKITRQSFVNSLLGHRFDIGGIKLDFTNDNQGSDLVVMTTLVDGNWQEINEDTWDTWL